MVIRTSITYIRSLAATALRGIIIAVGRAGALFRFLGGRRGTAGRGSVPDPRAGPREGVLAIFRRRRDVHQSQTSRENRGTAFRTRNKKALRQLG